jgi:hypothetical protein
MPVSGSMLVFWDLGGCLTIGWFVARCYCPDVGAADGVIGLCVADKTDKVSSDDLSIYKMDPTIERLLIDKSSISRPWNKR